MIIIFTKYFLLVIITLGLTSFSIPFINQIGFKKGFVDKPDKRKHHNKEIVRIGGLSIAFGFFIPFLSIIFLGWFNSYELININLIFLSSFCFFILGFIEDIFRISMISRLFSQIFISSMVWSFGLQIRIIDLSLILPDTNLINLPNIISLLITIVWIVGVTNSFNWIDGLDGLSSGLAAISLISFSILSIYFNQPVIFQLMGLLLGTCLGFLYFNFHPAKIFMGDGGSYLIGFLMSLFSIYTYNFLLENKVDQFALLFQFLILFVPIVDMAYVFFSRIFEGKSPFYPDRRHLHYRLQRIGFGHLETVLLCYLLSINFSLLAFSQVFLGYRAYLLVSSLIIIFFYYFLRFKRVNSVFNKVSKKFIKNKISRE